MSRWLPFRPGIHLILFQSQVLGRRHNTKSIGVAHTASPSLHTNNSVTTLENSKLHSVGNAPLETAVDILLPRHFIEVWFLFVEGEWVHSTVQMGVLVIKVSGVIDERRAILDGKVNILLTRAGSA